MSDQSVKATGDNAHLAKLATTKAGYYVDPFLDAFCKSSDGDSEKPVRKSSLTSKAKTDQARNSRRVTVQPIIKRGTHARVCVIDRAISTFLKMNHGSPAGAAYQVVVLGAGKDTSYFRYRNGNLMGMANEVETDETKPLHLRRRERPMKTENQQKVHWYEVDHVSVIKEKATLIRKSSKLKEFCPMLLKTEHGYRCGESNSDELESLLMSSTSSSSTYHLVGHDLRESPTTLLEKLTLNPTLPTLFIMECVSMYLPITDSKSLLQTLSLSADEVYIVCYEPILESKNSRGKGDPFGRVMERNLVKMGVATPDCCLLQTRTLKEQLEKLIECEGFVRAVGCDMWSAYETIVTDAQRKRANKSELMDEYEEWILIMQHYCFLVAQGGRSRDQPLPSDLTKVLDKIRDDVKPSSSLGWLSGKCLELE